MKNNKVLLTIIICCLLTTICCASVVIVNSINNKTIKAPETSSVTQENISNNGTIKVPVNTFYSSGLINNKNIDKFYIDTYDTAPIIGDAVALSTEGERYHEKSTLIAKIIDIKDNGDIIVDDSSYYIKESKLKTRTDDNYNLGTYSRDKILGKVVIRSTDEFIITEIDAHNAFFSIIDNESELLNTLSFNELIQTLKEFGFDNVQVGDTFNVYYYTDINGTFLYTDSYEAV